MGASPNFLYLYHPNRWQVMGGEVLPVLYELRRSPGVENVSPKGGGDMSPAIGAKVRDGWVVIPHDVIPGGYVRVFDGFQGPIHLSKWETPRQVGRRAYKPKIDVEGHREFLRGLIADGVIKPPCPEILEELVSRATARVERSAPNTATEAGKAVYDRAVQELHAIEIACGTREPEPKPKPKRSRKRARPKKAAEPAAAEEIGVG